MAANQHPREDTLKEYRIPYHRLVKRSVPIERATEGPQRARKKKLRAGLPVLLAHEPNHEKPRHQFEVNRRSVYLGDLYTESGQTLQARSRLYRSKQASKQASNGRSVFLENKKTQVFARN